jgi:hypothetical protein
MIFTFIGTYGYPLEMKERILMCFVMIAKATAQIALGPLATQKLPADAFPAQKEWAANVNNVAVLSVIFFAPVAAISATRIGPMVMKKDAEYEADAAAKAAIAATAPKVKAIVDAPPSASSVEMKERTNSPTVPSVPPATTLAVVSSPKP